MSVSKWAYLPDRCDGDVCVGDCDLCSKAQDNVAMMEGDSNTPNALEALDCIDRQAAIDILEERLRANGYSNVALVSELNRSIGYLMQLPTAHRPVDERKRGKWIVHENQRQEDVDNGNYLYVCSECGKSDIHAKTQKVPFCWWCGARMDGDA